MYVSIQCVTGNECLLHADSSTVVGGDINCFCSDSILILCPRPSPALFKLLDHQRRVSPYIFGRSPLIYDSKARFRTVAQSKSRRSSATLSSLSWESRDWCFDFDVDDRRNACRAMRSPSANRSPRSGQLRAGSKGFHLKATMISEMH
jgi:hypothetical protein